MKMTKQIEIINVNNEKVIIEPISYDIALMLAKVRISQHFLLEMVMDLLSVYIENTDKELKEKWIIKALREYNSGNPKDVAEYLLNKAKQSYGNKILDDMTVIVTTIWKIQ
jgi:hypothetical protein